MPGGHGVASGWPSEPSASRNRSSRGIERHPSTAPARAGQRQPPASPVASRQSYGSESATIGAATKLNRGEARTLRWSVMTPKPRIRKLRSAHFFITVREKGSSGPVDQEPGVTDRPSVQMAVPRRILRRAVDRNAVKRVFREVWRENRRADTSCPDNTSKDDRGLPTACGIDVHLRLTGKPPDFADLSRPKRKRFWRAELLTLLARRHR